MRLLYHCRFLLIQLNHRNLLVRTDKHTGYGPDYVAIAAQMSTGTAKKELAETAVKYDSLQAAYDAYKKLLKDGKYKQYKNSLDFNIHW